MFKVEMWLASFIPVLCNSEQAALIVIHGAAEISQRD